MNYIDLIAIGAIIALVMVYVFTIGKGRASVLLISTYIGVLTARMVPELFDLSDKVDLFQSDLQSVALLAVLIVLIHAIILRNGFFEPFVETERGESVAYGLAAVGLFLFAASYFLMPSTLETLSPWVKTAFYDTPFTFIWPLAPLAVILLIRGR